MPSSGAGCFTGLDRRKFAPTTSQGPVNQLTRSSALGDSPPGRAVSPWERFKNKDSWTPHPYTLIPKVWGEDRVSTFKRQNKNPESYYLLPVYKFFH